MSAPSLKVRHLIKHFPLGGGLFGRQRNVVRAVDGVRLEVRSVETIGFV